MGGCYLSQTLMRNSIIVSHFGFTAGMADWMSVNRWNKALTGQIDPITAPVSTEDKWHAHQLLLQSSKLDSASWKQLLGQVSSPLAKRRNSLDANSDRWFGDPYRWFGPCYNASKDVVVPPDFVMSPEEVEASRLAARVARAADCSAPEADHAGFSQRPTLLFMSGAIHDSAPWYSQRVRQELWKLHFNDSQNWTGVVFKPGQWTISQLRQSTFCLCPSGWGFGWRTVRRDRILNHDSCRL